MVGSGVGGNRTEGSTWWLFFLEKAGGALQGTQFRQYLPVKGRAVEWALSAFSSSLGCHLSHPFPHPPLFPPASSSGAFCALSLPITCPLCSPVLGRALLSHQPPLILPLKSFIGSPPGFPRIMSERTTANVPACPHLSPELPHP